MENEGMIGDADNTSDIMGEQFHDKMMFTIY